MRKLPKATEGNALACPRAPGLLGDPAGSRGVPVEPLQRPLRAGREPRGVRRRAEVPHRHHERELGHLGRGILAILVPAHLYFSNFSACTLVFYQL